MGKKPIRYYLLIVCGSVALVLGLIGLVLPVLPTTPFMIMAAGCYLHSSKRLYVWLTGHRILGPYIHNYITYRAVEKKTKMIALILLWISLLASSLMVDGPIRIILAVIGLAVSIHIVSLKTLVKVKQKAEHTDISKSRDLGVIDPR